MAGKRRNERLGPHTRAIHHGYAPEAMQGALVPPIFMTSTFAFESVAATEALVAGETDGHLYGRETNPTQALLETRLAELEGTEAAIVFASGMGAIGSLFLSLLQQGDEIVVHRTLYSNTYSLVHEALPRFGIRAVPADLTDPANLEPALSPRTRLVYFETPVNPTAEVIDIAAVAGRAHAAGVRVAVDSTFASPAVQCPVEHGADIVVHSLTKYINGHGDLLGGAVLADAETIERIRGVGLRYITGATLSPLAAYLVLRGLKTLHLRMERHGANGLATARMLAEHPAVAAVRYPFLEQDPGHAAARRQMRNGSAMLSFELKSGFEGARRMMDRLQLVARAVSLGDAESLIMHPGALVRARRKLVPGLRLAEGVSENLLRLSVGLEDVEDILADLAQALDGL